MLKYLGKWQLAAKVLPLAIILTILKYGLHHVNCEFISLNPLFSGLLAATVFLIGFLISGVLSDYKESERLPAELAIALEAIVDEVSSIGKNKQAPAAEECLAHTHRLIGAINRWLYHKESFENVMRMVSGLGSHFVGLESVAPIPFIVRLKQEQTALRRTLIRIHTIRETSFVRSAYAIAEIMTFLLILGLLLAKIDPFYESLFFVGIISFFLFYLLALIRDLDNPFEYRKNGYSGPDEISLHPLEAMQERIGFKEQ